MFDITLRDLSCGIFGMGGQTDVGTAMQLVNNLFSRLRRGAYFDRYPLPMNPITWQADGGDVGDLSPSLKLACHEIVGCWDPYTVDVDAGGDSQVVWYLEEWTCPSERISIE